MAQSCLATTGQLIEEYPGRGAGTDACRDAAHDIATQLQAACDTVREEPFVLRPRALWWVPRTIAVLYLLGTVLAALAGPWLYAGAVLCLAGLVYGIVQYLLFSPFFDPLFGSAGGCNVVGALEPSEAVRRQVLLVGHHDAAFVFNFLEYFQSVAKILMLLGMLFYLWLCGYSVVASVVQLVSGQALHLAGVPLWITLVGLLFTPALFFLMSSAWCPGAADNLNSTSMILALAAHFRSERDAGRPLRHTRLLVLSNDGEEIGERGAMAYLRAHGAELLATPTAVLNIDTICHADDLTVLTSDRNGLCGLSESMVSDLAEVASDVGVSLKRKPFPLGFGATDAWPFAAAGLEVTSMFGMPTDLVTSWHAYHTSSDTTQNIEAAAVSATLEIAFAYIKHVDELASEGGD